ncbi:GNAT family N-acetyltransferase [Methylomonas sp. EFPC3]|uniref:GNAT family N-acetyltransferase n=1 Tax=Methylomonas sp. EFPC3 TaxID=3021710 RepID=UPI0024171E7B|nr:GNAT family N-acetyltransferase [Methylomonas sp. EFPC3]WFP50248.1 GNAT family N-acetyltransferase [Methylomonas sp. EFPC3]
MAHDITRDNMAPYYRSLGREWDTALYRESWPTTENITIEHSGVVVGFLRLTQQPPAMYIRDLQIIETARGLGLGSYAIASAEQLARKQGIDTIRLRAFASNPAIRLYKRLGFAPLSEIAGLVTLEKQLSR